MLQCTMFLQPCETPCRDHSHSPSSRDKNQRGRLSLMTRADEERSNYVALFLSTYRRLCSIVVEAVSEGTNTIYAIRSTRALDESPPRLSVGTVHWSGSLFGGRTNCFDPPNRSLPQQSVCYAGEIDVKASHEANAPKSPNEKLFRLGRIRQFRGLEARLECSPFRGSWLRILASQTGAWIEKVRGK